MDRWTSLRSLTGQLAPSYTKAVIKAGLRTPQGARCVWIVVEDIDDVRVYERFFLNNATRILTSENENGQKGCSYVEEIVTAILAEETDPLIFGIRDRDYTRYESPEHVFPSNIFVTDYRDIEMMMFSASSVLADLDVWSPDLRIRLSEGKPVVRKMGYIRVCNHLYNLGCNFKRKVKISRLWNDTTHSLIPDWEAVLVSLFLNNTNIPFTEEQLCLEENRLVAEDDLNICQGHDTVRLLQYMMVHTQYSETNMMSRMTNAYSLTDFKTTQLCEHILRWASNKGVNIMA